MRPEEKPILDSEIQFFWEQKETVKRKTVTYNDFNKSYFISRIHSF